MNHISAVAMQIAAGSICGISNRSVLTQLRALADKIAEESEKCLFEGPLDDYSEGMFYFTKELQFYIFRHLL